MQVGFAPQAIAQQIVPASCEPRYVTCMAEYDRAHGGGFDRGHVKGALLGDGSFDVWKSFDVMGWGSHECMPLYWEAASLLGTLQACTAPSRTECPTIASDCMRLPRWSVIDHDGVYSYSYSLLMIAPVPPGWPPCRSSCTWLGTAC